MGWWRRVSQAENTIRYSIEVWVEHQGPGQQQPEFIVTGTAVPRVGEILRFDCVPDGLNLVVTDVAHWMFPTTELGAKPYELSVSCDPQTEADIAVARKLADPASLARWIELFPALSPVP